MDVLFYLGAKSSSEILVAYLLVVMGALSLVVVSDLLSSHVGEGLSLIVAVYGAVSDEECRLLLELWLRLAYCAAGLPQSRFPELLSRCQGLLPLVLMCRLCPSCGWVLVSCCGRVPATWDVQGL